MMEKATKIRINFNYFERFCSKDFAPFKNRVIISNFTTDEKMPDHPVETRPIETLIN
jgi:hypothetical protein